MATKKKVAAKAVKSVKPTAPAKKAKTPVAKKAAPAPTKKAVAVKSVKKALPVKNTKVASKGSVKPAPAKNKVTPKKVVKKVVTSKTAKVVATKKTQPATISKKVKKDLSPVKNTTTKTPAKKAAPASKAAPVKKVAEKTKVVVKKVAEPKAAPKPVKKEAPAKPVAKVEVKPVAKKPVAAPAPPPPAPVAKKAKSSSPAKKVVKTIKTITTSITGRPAPAPVPVSAAAARPSRDEKKPAIIVAHRRVDNKTKNGNDSRTMINYQPDFNRSILDEPVQQQGPVYRYSDEELTEFRELITNRLESARKELLYLQGLITRKDEAGTEDTENRYMNMEDGSGAMEREQLAQLASRQIQFINHLEKAMIRIENKTYGICRVTGKLIDKARLRAVPHATLSIEAKKYMAGK